MKLRALMIALIAIAISFTACGNKEEKKDDAMTEQNLEEKEGMSESAPMEEKQPESAPMGETQPESAPQ